ncbi:MAG: septum site-determining protein MinC [Syntrophomonadaceae bacterium]
MAIVNIKGFNNNLVFILGDGTIDDYHSYLTEKFEANKQLFKGSQIIFKGEGLKKLTYQEIASLQQLCLDYGMVLNNTEMVKEKPIVEKDLIVRKTLRSGQSLHSEGSLVIWGDVHESAQVTAVKDVIVLGKLEGVVHAGCYGDTGSIIFALNLAPRQIRIGDKISRNSDNDTSSNYAEIAYVEGDHICVREYRSRDTMSLAD